MTHNKNIRQHADYLLYLWFGMMVFTIIISATFQYDLASTPIQRFVGVGLGILFPLITSALLTSSILLFSKRLPLWGLGAAMIFLSAFIWEGHSHYSFWSESMEIKAGESQFSKVQAEQLKAVNDRLDNVPIVGAVFTDSIDTEIEAAKTALERCPDNQTTVCKKPLQNKYFELLSRKEQNGVQAQTKRKRDELLSEKQSILAGMSGTDEDTENAKAMPVFKGVSRFFYGDIHKAKYIESVAYVAFSILCTVIASGMLGIRAKLLESEEIQQPINQQQRAYTQNNDSPTPPPQPESWKDRYKKGDVGLASAIFGRGREPSAQPSANAAANIGDFADAINRKNATGEDAMAQQQDKRGLGEFREFDDAIIPNEVNTTSPTLMAGVGFRAQEVPNPNYKAPTNAPIIHWQQESPAGVEIELPEPEEVAPPCHT